MVPHTLKTIYLDIWTLFFILFVTFCIHYVSWFYDYSRVLQHIYTGTFFAVYTALIGLIQVKFQNKANSAFETHISFIIMYVVALPLAIITSGILFYTNNPLEKSKINFTPIHYTLLKIVFSFSTILAPLSLVSILFIPPQLNWIGYLIIYAIFAVTVANNVLGYKRLHEKKDLPNLGAHQMV